ncbi:hypothetical protein EVAR_61064_1 [Eumeta japonica]|uniref:Uncharacterized protein n=1 Tax=Eumeta variegata TaxID=151549 RepID=A0A4C1Z7K9_EUMVA|nr:hypothetical protein EVAR_61064_1 [Eumeta japonica]
MTPGTDRVLLSSLTHPHTDVSAQSRGQYPGNNGSNQGAGSRETASSRRSCFTGKYSFYCRGRCRAANAPTSPTVIRAVSKSQLALDSPTCY